MCKKENGKRRRAPQKWNLRAVVFLCGLFFLLVRCGSASDVKLALWSEKGGEIAERR